MKKSRTTEETIKKWEIHIERHRKSGQSQKGYCRQEGISYWSFNSWKRKIEAGNNKLQEIPTSLVQSLALKNKEKIKLILECGIKISIPDGFSEETLGKILRMAGVWK